MYWVLKNIIAAEIQFEWVLDNARQCNLIQSLQKKYGDIFRTSSFEANRITFNTDNHQATFLSSEASKGHDKLEKKKDYFNSTENWESSQKTHRSPNQPELGLKSHLGIFKINFFSKISKQSGPHLHISTNLIEGRRVKEDVNNLKRRKVNCCVWKRKMCIWYIIYHAISLYMIYDISN